MATDPSGTPEQKTPQFQYRGRDGDIVKLYAQTVKNGLEELGSDAAPKASKEPNATNSHGSSTEVDGKADTTTDDSNQVNSTANQDANRHGEGVFSVEFEDRKGGPLVSTKAPESYKDALTLDEAEHSKRPKTNQDELVSGRLAGASWHRSAIAWAPLNIPLQRRLQTLAVLYHGLSIGALLAAFFALCAVPILWPVLVPYLIYCLFSTDGSSGKLTFRSERFRRSRLWSLFASYYPARLHRSAELPSTRKYIFGYHPHGIISHGALAAFGTEALGFAQLFPGITNTLLTLDSNFRIPLYRDYILALGLQSVSRESCENLLNRGGHNGEGMGRAITIVVGGARESLDADPKQLKLVLKRRKGFVKLAIRNGADLVPVLGFGENELYDQFQADTHPRIHKLQLLAKRYLGFTVPLFHARGVFNYDVGLLPYRRPLNILVGRPIYVHQQAKPDDAYVDEMHQRYMDELQRMWDDWKDVFAKDRTGEMQIVE